jgi:hypothetical protein
VRRPRAQPNERADSVRPLRRLGEAANRVARAKWGAVAVLSTVVSVVALVGVGRAFALRSSSGEEALRSGMPSRDSSTSGARSAAPRLQQIDGGLGYYGKFSNPLPTSASFFPIGVWGSYAHEPDALDKDAAAGINTYVWVGDSQYLPDIRADGRFRVIQDGSKRANHRSETAGWLLGDEIDMTQGPGACPRALNSIKAGLPNDGRLRFTNYGKGVLIWGASGYAGHNDASSGCFINAQDVTSADLYWHTDPNESGPLSGSSSGYGWSMRRMRMLDRRDGKIKPQWGFVEVTDAMNGGSPPTPAEIRGAVWHTLIAGARGILYFQHDFAGQCQTHHALRMVGTACYGETIKMVTSIDHRIKSLARVLNAPFVTSRHSARDRMPGKVRYMVKWARGKFWVFAGADLGGGNASFRIRCVGDATAKVLWENRSIPVRRGSFTDSFTDKNAIHIYRIDGGSRCGLK